MTVVRSRDLRVSGGIFSPENYGAVGDGVTDDTAAVQACINAVISQKGVGRFRSQYLVTSTIRGTTTTTAGIVLEGEGWHTGLIASGAFTALDIGPTSGNMGANANGRLANFGIATTAGASITAGIAGLTLRGFSLGIVDSVTVRGKWDMACDMIQNCYGMIHRNCRYGFGEVNVGVNVRTGNSFGNDVTFQNCWVNGLLAAMYCSGGSSGVRIRSGQWSCLRATSDDLAGVFVLGKDYLTGTASTMGTIDVIDCDIEAFQNCWAFRGFQSVGLTVENCNILANGSTSAIGIYKHETAGSSKVAFRNCYNGSSSSFYTSATILSVAGQSSGYEIEEAGWVGNLFYGAATNGTGGTASVNPLDSMAIQSGQSTLVYGHHRVTSHVNLLLGSGRVRTNNTTLLPEFSGDNAASWQLLEGWEFLASTSMGSAAVTSGAITVAARDQLLISVRVVSMSVSDIPALRFNADTGANYWTRFLTAAAGGVTLTNTQTASTTMLRLSGNAGTAGRTTTLTVSNRSASTKLATIDTQLGSGAAATIPAADFGGGGEWVNTSAQITSVTLLSVGGTATLGIGSGFAVFGRNL